MSVVTKAKADEMNDYVANLLRFSGQFDVKQYKDHIMLTVNKTGQRCYVMLHTESKTELELAEIINSNFDRGNNIANIFYKDHRDEEEENEETFHRMLNKNDFKKDSLKGYNPFKLKSMIKLRVPEKIILCTQEELFLGDILTYFQPEKEGFKNSLTFHKMNPVYYNYTFLRPGDNGYYHAVNGRMAKKYKISEKLDEIISGEKLKLMIFEKSPFVLLTTQKIMDSVACAINS